MHEKNKHKSIAIIFIIFLGIIIVVKIDKNSSTNIKHIIPLFMSTGNLKSKKEIAITEDQNSPDSELTWAHSDSRHHHIFAGKYKNMAPVDVAMSESIKGFPNLLHTRKIRKNPLRMLSQYLAISQIFNIGISKSMN